MELSFMTEDGFIRTPAFAGKVVDRIGAGDAIISITAGLACLNAPADIIGLLQMLLHQWLSQLLDTGHLLNRWDYKYITIHCLNN